MTCSVHQLHHLSRVVENYGPLWTTWMFTFESWNGIVTSYVHSKQHIEIQLMDAFHLQRALKLFENILPLNQSNFFFLFFFGWELLEFVGIIFWPLVQSRFGFLEFCTKWVYNCLTDMVEWWGESTELAIGPAYEMTGWKRCISWAEHGMLQWDQNMSEG